MVGIRDKSGLVGNRRGISLTLESTLVVLPLAILFLGFMVWITTSKVIPFSHKLDTCVFGYYVPEDQCIIENISNSNETLPEVMIHFKKNGKICCPVDCIRKDYLERILGLHSNPLIGSPILHLTLNGKALSAGGTTTIRAGDEYSLKVELEKSKDDNYYEYKLKVYMEDLSIDEPVENSNKNNPLIHTIQDSYETNLQLEAFHKYKLIVKLYRKFKGSKEEKNKWKEVAGRRGTYIIEVVGGKLHYTIENVLISAVLTTKSKSWTLSFDIDCGNENCKIINASKDGCNIYNPKGKEMNPKELSFTFPIGSREYKDLCLILLGKNKRARISWKDILNRLSGEDYRINGGIGDSFIKMEVGKQSCDEYGSCDIPVNISFDGLKDISNYIESLTLYYLTTSSNKCPSDPYIKINIENRLKTSINCVSNNDYLCYYYVICLKEPELCFKSEKSKEQYNNEIMK